MQSIHTILFVQPGNAHTRTYVNFDSPDKAIRGVIKVYENRLRERNPDSLHIVYTAYDVFEFLDQLKDISCLIYDESLKGYLPHKKAWIKEQVYLVLKNSCSK